MNVAQSPMRAGRTAKPAITGTDRGETALGVVPRVYRRRKVTGRTGLGMHQLARRQQAAAGAATAPDHHQDRDANAVALPQRPVVGLARGPAPVIQRVSKAEKKRRDARRAAAAAEKSAARDAEPSEAATPEPEAEAAEAGEAGPVAGAGPTTPAEAAGWLWHHDGTFQHSMPATSFKLKHFTPPTPKAARDLVTDAASLAAFRAAWAQLSAAEGPGATAGQAEPAGPASVTDQVLADMKGKFERWKKNGAKDGRFRGAWWGPHPLGRKTGATRVPAEAETPEFRAEAIKRGWEYGPSDTGGMSYKKKVGGVAFIYHLLPPAD